MSSAAEAEVGGLFENAREACVLRLALEELGHPQPATPLETDNTTAHGIIKGTVKQQRSRAMDMRFYWVQDRVKQKQFMLVWGPGESNLGDYYTKHHPKSHHRKVRPLYVHTPLSPSLIPRSAERIQRGCVDPDPTSNPGNDPQSHIRSQMGLGKATPGSGGSNPESTQVHNHSSSPTRAIN